MFDLIASESLHDDDNSDDDDDEKACDDDDDDEKASDDDDEKASDDSRLVGEEHDINYRSVISPPSRWEPCSGSWVPSLGIPARQQLGPRWLPPPAGTGDLKY